MKGSRGGQVVPRAIVKKQFVVMGLNIDGDGCVRVLALMRLLHSAVVVKVVMLVSQLSPLQQDS